MGFYMHFIQIISEFITNDDIRTKNYLLKALIILLDVDDSVDEEEDEEKKKAIEIFSLDISCKIRY
jgi:citrate lyase beta subunit